MGNTSPFRRTPRQLITGLPLESHQRFGHLSGFRRQELPYRATHHLIRLVAEHPGQRGIEIHDPSLLVNHQTFKGGLGKQPEALLAVLQGFVEAPVLFELLG
jgi:hypothetical protein